MVKKALSIGLVTTFLLIVSLFFSVSLGLYSNHCVLL